MEPHGHKAVRQLRLTAWPEHRERGEGRHSVLPQGRGYGPSLLHGRPRRGLGHPRAGRPHVERRGVSVATRVFSDDELRLPQLDCVWCSALLSLSSRRSLWYRKGGACGARWYQLYHQADSHVPNAFVRLCKGGVFSLCRRHDAGSRSCAVRSSEALERFFIKPELLAGTRLLPRDGFSRPAHSPGRDHEHNSRRRSPRFHTTAL